jgi:hypothetical protein
VSLNKYAVGFSNGGVGTDDARAERQPRIAVVSYLTYGIILVSGTLTSLGLTSLASYQ